VDSAIPSLRAVDTSPRRIGRVLIPAFMLAGVLGVLKGLPPRLVPGSEFYWLLTYGHGFVTRALVGTLVAPLLRIVPFERLEPAILIAHASACLLVIYLSHRLFAAAADREPEADARMTVSVAFLCLMCCEWMPMLAHDAGYVDVYLVIIALAAFQFVLDGRYTAAALTASIGPFVHEAFVFLWAPVVLMLLWSCTARDTTVGRRLLAAGLPIACTAAIMLAENHSTARTAIDALPITEQVKDGLRYYQFDQSLFQRFDEMRRLQYRGNSGRVFTSAAFFLLPNVGLVWAALFCGWRRWWKPWLAALVAVGAALAPLAMLALAWDLSRFLVWANFAAALALIGSTAPTLFPRRGEASSSEASGLKPAFVPDERPELQR